jgi:hypothetical protein
MENLIRAGNLDDDGEPEFVTFGSWGHAVSAIDDDGRDLWTYAGPDTGTDDVWVTDLDGDGRDEVIIGYNGGGGLHVADSNGETRWSRTDLGNCWHVCGGDADGDGKAEVLSTDARGSVYVFAADGTPRSVLAATAYANMVRVTRPSPEAPPLIVGAGDVGSAAGDSGALFGFTFDAKAQWSTAPPAETVDHIVEAQVAPGRPWLAALNRRKTDRWDILVLDTRNGELLAMDAVPDAQSGLAWVTPKGDGEPMLAVTTSNGVSAFRLVL